MAISANTKMTAKVLMVAKSRAIEARSGKHRGEKQRFCFGRPRHDSRNAASARSERRACGPVVRIVHRTVGLAAPEQDDDYPWCGLGAGECADGPAWCCLGIGSAVTGMRDQG